MAATAKTRAVNTLYLWGRLVVTLGATVLATRFALEALGVEAFGVFVAVAGLPMILTFLTGAMLATTQRMLSVEMNKTDAAPAQIFNTSLGLHGGVALLIAVAGEVGGQWMLRHILDVPPDLREGAALAMRVVVAGAALGAFLAPYEALFRVHERFGLFAVLEMLRAFVLLWGSWVLLDYAGDRLVGYAVVQAVSTMGAALLGAAIVAWRIPTSRIRPGAMVDTARMGAQLGLFSWTVFGSFAAIARIQGLVILANALFGPSASAALGVGNQVVSVLRQFSTTVDSVLAPQIYRIEGSGDRAGMIGAALLACKYSTAVALALAVPLMIEVQTVLTLWLGTPPPGAVIAVMGLSAALILDQLSHASGTAHLATGRIARYQILCGGVGIMVLPAGYLIAQQGGTLAHVLLALAGIAALVSALRLVLLEPQGPGVVDGWTRRVVGPMVFAGAASALAGLAVASAMEPGPWRVLVTTAASTLVLGAIVLRGLEPEEKVSMAAILPWRLGRRA